MKRSLALLAVLAASAPALAHGQEAREGAPRVHVQTTEPATTLFEVTRRIFIRGRPAGFTAKPVCQAACDRIVDAQGGKTFFFAGEGLTPSSQFQLTGKGPEVSIDVAPGSAGKRTGGYVMAVFGGAGLLGGLTTLALGALSTSVSGGQTQASPSTRMIGAGGAAAGVGLGLLIGGILMVTNSKTTYTFPGPGKSTALLTF
jgi:hypothetical protein